jgi:hypothetical protein
VPAVEIEFSDVRRRLPKIKEDRANELIVGTLALARIYAPCIASTDFAYSDAARMIILRSIERQAQNSPGLVRESKTIGGAMISREVAPTAGEIFTTTEVAALQNMCPAVDQEPFGSFPDPMFSDDPVVSYDLNKWW